MTTMTSPSPSLEELAKLDCYELSREVALRILRWHKEPADSIRGLSARWYDGRGVQVYRNPMFAVEIDQAFSLLTGRDFSVEGKSSQKIFSVSLADKNGVKTAVVNESLPIAICLALLVEHYRNAGGAN